VDEHFSVPLVRFSIWTIADSVPLAAWFFDAFLAVALGLAGCSSDQSKINETKQRGDQIIQALEQFIADQRHYPRSLSELSPKYIEKLPTPAWGLKAWQYEADEDEFTLKVDESIHTGDGNSRWLRYQGEKWGWQIGD